MGRRLPSRHSQARQPGERRSRSGGEGDGAELRRAAGENQQDRESWCSWVSDRLQVGRGESSEQLPLGEGGAAPQSREGLGIGPKVGGGEPVALKVGGAPLQGADTGGV